MAARRAMDTSYQIVGSVIAAKPAADLIDAFVAQVRRERAFVLARSAQGATFVRFNAPDAAIVQLALRSLRGPAAALLRFGFTVGTREQAAAVAPDGADLSARSVEQANELAAAAADGEVLVGPQLAVPLIEAGLELRSRQLVLANGRTLAACVVESRGETRDGHAAASAAGTAGGSAGAVSAAAAAAPQELHAAGAAGAAGDLMRVLLQQAAEVTRRQAEIEARQDALLARMTLVDEGSQPTLQMNALEAEMQAQLARVEERVEFIGKLEHRFNRLQSMAGELERKLGEQLRRRADVENLKAMTDTLVDQMVTAHEKLDGLLAEQGRLAPLSAMLQALNDGLQEAERLLAGYSGRLAELDGRGQALERRLAALAASENRVQDLGTQIETIRELANQSRDDLQFLTEHEGEVTSLVARIDDIGTRTIEAEQRLKGIESRRELVEEVRAHAEAAVHLMGDVQLKLDLLNEQRAVIDHALDQLATVGYSAQEAQNTLRALQRERELAERIERSIKALRAWQPSTG